MLTGANLKRKYAAFNFIFDLWNDSTKDTIQLTCTMIQKVDLTLSWFDGHTIYVKEDHDVPV